MLGTEEGRDVAEGGGGGERSHGCLRRGVLKRVSWLCRIQRRFKDHRSGMGIIFIDNRSRQLCTSKMQQN